MKLEEAVKKLNDTFGNYNDIEAITKILKQFGAPDTVPDNVLNKVMLAGKALRKIGVK